MICEGYHSYYQGNFSYDDSASVTAFLRKFTNTSVFYQSRSAEDPTKCELAVDDESWDQLSDELKELLPLWAQCTFRIKELVKRDLGGPSE